MIEPEELDWRKILRKYAEGVMEAEGALFGPAEGLRPLEISALYVLLEDVENRYWQKRHAV